jgi:hypothetical protein
MSKVISSAEVVPILSNAHGFDYPVKAVVRVGDETRTRIGTIDKLVHDVVRPYGGGYVTFALQDGTYRTAKLRDVVSVEVL